MRTVEVLNLKTDGSLKGDLIEMSADRVLAKQRHNRMSVTSAAPGVAVNAVLSGASPIAPASLFLNVVQLGVASTNRPRIKREIRRRIKVDPEFGIWLAENDRLGKDNVIAITIRCAIMGLTLSIVGVDTVQNFADLHLAHLIANHGAGHTTEHGAQTIYELFKNQHPNTAAADTSLHKGTSGLGDKWNGVLEHVTGWYIADDTSWPTFEHMLNSATG